MRTIKYAFVAIVLTFLNVTSVKADIVTLNFSGTITTSQIQNIPVGSPFTETWVYETPGVVSDDSPPSTSYFMTASPDQLTFNVGGYYFSTTTFGATVTVAPTYDSLDIEVDLCCDNMDNYPGQPQIGAMQFQLLGAPGFLQSTALPESWDATQIEYGLDSNASFGIIEGSSELFVGGQFTSASLVVPEPASLGLILPGVALLVAVLGRSRKNRQATA